MKYFIYLWNRFINYILSHNTLLSPVIFKGDSVYQNMNMIMRFSIQIKDLKYNTPNKEWFNKYVRFKGILQFIRVIHNNSTFVVDRSYYLDR